MWAVGIHGGAGPFHWQTSEAQSRALESILAWAEQELVKGAAALDAVEGAIRRLEDCSLFVAGRGSYPNSAGVYELDASICDGQTRLSGAVAALSGVYPPISIARAVMERTDHVLLVGEGARQFALDAGFAPIEVPRTFFVTRAQRGKSSRGSDHGTVGAVALDQEGGIAAGTSTGGTFGKMPGRVGDSPIVGAGTWADEFIGVSCTGRGEYFIRTAAAHSVALRYRLPVGAPGDALDEVLAEIAGLGGEGGILAVDAKGMVHFAFNADAMRVAYSTSFGLREVSVAVNRGAG